MSAGRNTDLGLDDVVGIVRSYCAECNGLDCTDWDCKLFPVVQVADRSQYKIKAKEYSDEIIDHWAYRL